MAERREKRKKRREEEEGGGASDLQVINNKLIIPTKRHRKQGEVKVHRRQRTVLFQLCVLHDEWSSAAMIGTVPDVCPRFLQVDVAGGGVVGVGLQNGPVAPDVHQI